MTKKINVLLVLATFTVCAGAVSAQESRAGRYTMHKSDDGFVRLDTQTGAVSLCRKTTDGWGCLPMADGASSHPAEVARLKRENADLRAEIKRMEQNLGLHGDAGKPASKSRDFKLPTEKEVDQAFDYFERMLKKFQDRLKRLEVKPEAPERQL